MTIRKVCEVEVRVGGSGKVTLIFAPMRGGLAEKDTDGSPLRFAIPLNQDALGVSGVVHDFARWITGLCVKEVQDQQAQI